MRALVVALLLSVASLAQARRAAPVPPPAPVTGPGSPAIDEVLKTAAGKNQPVVIEFFTDWCGPCKVMERYLEDPSVRASLAGITLVRYDAEKGNGVAAAQRFGVKGYPTLLIADGSGKVLRRMEGAPESVEQVNDFLALLAGKRDAAGIKALEADAKAGPGRFLIAARWYAAHRQRKEALAAYARAVKADPRGTEGVAPVATWEAAQLKAAQDRRGTLVAQAAVIVEKWPDSAAAAEALPLAVVSGDLPMPRVNKLLAARRKALENDGRGLNSLIYVAIAAGACDEAIAAGQQQVKLVPGDPNPYDSLAEAYHCKGNTQMAVSTEELAMAHADGDAKHEYDDNYARFKAGGTECAGNARLKARIDAQLDGGETPGVEDDGGAVGGVVGGTLDPETEALWQEAMRVTKERLSKSVAARCRGKLPTGGQLELTIRLPEEGGAGDDLSYQGPPELERCAREAIMSGPEFPPLFGHDPEVHLQITVPEGSAPPSRPLRTSEPPRRK